MMPKQKTLEKQPSRRPYPRKRLACLELLALSLCLLAAFTALPEATGEFQRELRGRVLDENSKPLQNATVTVWQVEELKARSLARYPYDLDVWTPSPYIKGSLISSTKTNVDGFFNVILNATVVWPYEYRLYIYPSDFRYVPFVRFLGVSPELPEDFTVQLTPAAIYIFDNDVLIVDSATPWQSITPLVFQVSPFSTERVFSFCDPADSYFGEAHSYFLGLEPRQVIVPAQTSVDIVVDAVTGYRKEEVSYYPLIIHDLIPEKFSFKIEQLPVLEQGQALHIDIRKYAGQYNLQVVQDLLQEAERSLEKAQRIGFHILAEEQDLTEAKNLLLSAERKHINELYTDSYVDILQAYQIATHLIQRINSIYPEAAISAIFLPLFLALTAVVVASLIFESEKSKAFMASIVYVFLAVSIYYLYPGGRLVETSVLIGASIAYIVAVSILALILPRLIKETAFNRRIALGSAIVALFSLAKRNIRRRKLRFILSLATVTISIASFIALTSASMEFGLIVRRAKRSPPAEGLLVRSTHTISSPSGGIIPFTPMKESDIAWLAARNGTALVAPRSDNIPTRVIRYIGQEETREYYDPLGSLTSPSLKDKIFFNVVGIVPSAEAASTHLDSIVKVGRYPTDNETNAILLSEKAANELGVQVGDMLSWSSQRASSGPGMDDAPPFKLVGILGDSDLSNFRDLDGQPFLHMCQKQLEEHVLLDGSHVRISAIKCSLDEVIITTYQGAHYFSDPVLLSRVNVLMDNPETILPFARELAIMRNFKIWASIGEDLYSYELGSFAEIGGSGIAVALTIVVLTIGATMSASVYERRHEMKILSAVGLNPSHITMLFVDQAIIIGLIGGAFGYLLGTSLYKVFVLFPTDIVVRQKLSSGWSLVALTLGIGIAALGAAIPAIKASILATPSLLRQWKIERKPSSVGEAYVSEIPVKVQRTSIDNFVNYLIRSLQEYGKAEPFHIKRIARTHETTPEKSTTHIEFTYFFPLQISSFLATNDIAVTIKKNEDYGTVQLSSKGAGPDEEKHIRRIASLIRNLAYEWSSQKAIRH